MISKHKPSVIKNNRIERSASLHKSVFISYSTFRTEPWKHTLHAYMYIQWEMRNTLYMRWTTRHNMAVLKQEMHFPSHTPSLWKRDGVHFQRIISIISSASITLSCTSTLITPDITKNQSKFFFNVHCFKENNDKHSVARNTVFTLLLEIMHCALTWVSCLLADN